MLHHKYIKHFADKRTHTQKINPMNAQNNGLFKSTIQKAINSCQAIIIHEYQSSSRGSSMKCRDRHILPIKIKGDMVLCFDISLDGAWRCFKFDKIHMITELAPHDPSIYDKFFTKNFRYS